MFVWRGDDWSGTTWSCHIWGVGRIRRLCVGPGIAKSRPGESGQGGGGVLPADFFKIFLEFGALCLGNDACSNVACLVVAVNEAFITNPPMGAHEDGVVPLRVIRRAFSCKILPPVFAFLYQKFGDGGGVLDDVISIGFVRFPFLSLSLLLAVEPRRGIEFGRWVLGRGFDEVGQEDHVEGAIHDHLEDLVKGYEAVIDH